MGSIVKNSNLRCSCFRTVRFRVASLEVAGKVRTETCFLGPASAAVGIFQDNLFGLSVFDHHRGLVSRGKFAPDLKQYKERLGQIVGVVGMLIASWMYYEFGFGGSRIIFL